MTFAIAALSMLQPPAAVVTGTLPPSLAQSSRIVWMAPGEAAPIPCAVDAGRWTCPAIPDPAHAVVVAIAADAIGFQPGASGAAMKIRRSGRLITIEPGAAAPEDLHDLRVTAWVPQRSAVRARSTRLAVAVDPATDVLPLSATTFWLATDVADPDAFALIEGPSVGRVRIPTALAIDGPLEAAFYVSAQPASALAGRVVSTRGDVIADAEVELFEPVVSQRIDAAADDLQSRPMTRIGSTQTDANGEFHFDRMAGGPFVASVLDPRGRGSAVVRTASEPVTIRLEAPARATGRVLRNRAPVEGARVRFLPDAALLAAAPNGRDLVSSEEATAADGRFALPLPPAPSGVVQVIAPDGASVRVPLARASASADVQIGDVSLPDPRRLLVRVLDAAACQLMAIGPLASVGFTIVAAGVAGPNLYSLDLPEPGQWMLNLRCGEQEVPIQPAMVVVSDDGAPPLVDLRVLRR